ncbi:MULTISPECIES: isochorismatase family protein [unclassified Prochlorococcus]|uniref:isochorismatase family protein n=1 Tax=unclassified Prochlorococcus TaxID=2627481 RepID=UPI000690187A|nr:MULTISPECIES: isochorismatase family protein [unclassified Prochlorococcus]
MTNDCPNNSIMDVTYLSTHSLLPSRNLMQPDDTALLIIDVQERLIQAVDDQKQIVWNIRRLIDAANVLCIEIATTEQYPQRLGHTIELIATRTVNNPFPKLSFSCVGCVELLQQFRKSGIKKVLLCGIEAHVCVLQTALDLISNDYQVFLAVDAIGSRRRIDLEFALRRMESVGVTLTTTESVMFEWCHRADRVEFKTISNLVKECLSD